MRAHSIWQHVWHPLRVRYSLLNLSRFVVMSSLERVLTIHQTSMGVTRLPLELQQQVFSYLDTKAFYAARKVCKWWRFASDDAVALSRQLKKLPIHPPVDASRSTSRELQHLFGVAAHSLLLDLRVARLTDAGGSMHAARRTGTPIGPKVRAVSQGSRTVTVNDRTMAVFDTSGRKPVVVSQRPLNDLKETVGNGPWLKVTGNPAYELALSSNGSLLAVAQERTIQIYDLGADSDSFTVNEYITCAAGSAISGVVFEQNDHVLRVNLNGNGTVLYLGTPPLEQSCTENATIHHWKSKAGLKHTYLDSSFLTLDLQTTAADNTVRLSGLQLLQRFQDGYLFAAQRHGGNGSSHYILGHIKSKDGCIPCADAVQSGSMTVLARLESFLSSWDYTLSGIHESGMGLWENMPSAHEHHPNFALSPDGTMLVLAERDKKSIRPNPLTQVFLYRLPGPARLDTMLRENRLKAGAQWSSPPVLAPPVLAPMRDDERQAQRKAPIMKAGTSSKPTVGRIPLCLSTVQGLVAEMRFDDTSSTGQRACRLSVTTPESTRSWSFTEM